MCGVEHMSSGKDGVEVGEASSVEGGDCPGTQQVLAIRALQLCWWQWWHKGHQSTPAGRVLLQQSLAHTVDLLAAEPMYDRQPAIQYQHDQRPPVTSSQMHESRLRRWHA